MIYEITVPLSSYVTPIDCKSWDTVSCHVRVVNSVLVSLGGEESVLVDWLLDAELVVYLDFRDNVPRRLPSQQVHKLVLSDRKRFYGVNRSVEKLC